MNPVGWQGWATLGICPARVGALASNRIPADLTTMVGGALGILDLPGAVGARAPRIWPLHPSP